MICSATYDSLDAIPDVTIGDTRLRDEFEQVNGKWQLKSSAIPGVGPLFNKELAKNSDRQLTQLNTARTKITTLQTELDDVKDKLAVLDTPGHKVLSKEDAENFDKYVALGTPKELETVVSEHKDLAVKAKQFETADALSKVANASSGLNADVLADWAMSPEGEGLTFFLKPVEQTDAKGTKTTVEVPHVRIESVVNGKTQVSEQELLTFAKEKLAPWKFDALTTASKDMKQTTGVKPVTPTGAVKLPDLGSSTGKPAGTTDAKKPVDIMNERRAAKPNAFTNPLLPVGTGVVMPKIGS